MNGNELLADKLYYSVWIEKDGEQQPFVFKSYDYWGIFEDTAEIPYSLDCWDITTGGETITFYDFGASGSDHLFYYALNTGDTLTVSMPQCGPDAGDHAFTPGCSVSGSFSNT